MLRPMKRMGIDFGSKKVGVALTDDAGMMAFPHAVVPNDASLVSYVAQLVADRGIEEIIIGHSLNNKGIANPIHVQVEQFITDITLAVGIPVHLEPEQYSSQQAIQIQGRNAQTDASAAALILDGFLTKHKSK